MVNTPPESIVSIASLKGSKDIKIVKISGELNSNSLTDVNMKVLPLLENGGVINLVFDLTKLRYISSPALGILINYYKKTHENGGDTVFFGLNKNIEEIFMIMGLSKVFKIFRKKNDALAFLRE